MNETRYLRDEELVDLSICGEGDEEEGTPVTLPSEVWARFIAAKAAYEAAFEPVATALALAESEVRPAGFEPMISGATLATIALPEKKES